jgi:hypothetical protein
LVWEDEIRESLLEIIRLESKSISAAHISILLENPEMGFPRDLFYPHFNKSEYRQSSFSHEKPPTLRPYS